MNESVQYQVSKRNIREITVARGPAPTDCDAGQVLLRIDRFALTANNVTYGVAGDQIGYWQFFPPSGGDENLSKDHLCRRRTDQGSRDDDFDVGELRF